MKSIRRVLLFLVRECFNAFPFGEKKVKTMEEFTALVRKKGIKAVDVKALEYMWFFPKLRTIPHTRTDFPFCFRFFARTPWGREIFYEKKHTENLDFDAGYISQKRRDKIVAEALEKEIKNVKVKFPDINFSLQQRYAA